MLKTQIWLPLAAFMMMLSPVFAQDSETDAAGGSSLWMGEVTDGNPDREVAVNLRGGNGINYKILSVLKEGQRLVVHEKRDDWLKVEPLEMAIPVWVKKGFIGISEDGRTICLTDRVVMRSAATTNSAPLGYLSVGQEVTLRKTVNGWSWIEAPRGTTAWISSKYVREIPGGMATLAVKADSSQEVSETEAPVEPTGESKETTVAGADEEPTVTNKENEEIDTDLERIRKEFETRLQELQRKRKRDLSTSEELAGMAAYTATGRIVNGAGVSGLIKLELGGRTTYYLKPALNDEKQPKVDLKAFLGRTVGLLGRIVEQEDGSRWLIVESVELLNSPE